jgi:hypothetical protein
MGDVRIRPVGSLSMAYALGETLGFGVLVLLSLVLPIWIAARAKPIGNKSYKWGTYIGVMAGLLGFLFVSVGLFERDASGTNVYSEVLYSRVASIMMGASGAVGSFGAVESPPIRSNDVRGHVSAAFDCGSTASTYLA